MGQIQNSLATCLVNIDPILTKQHEWSWTRLYFKNQYSIWNSPTDIIFFSSPRITLARVLVLQFTNLVCKLLNGRYYNYKNNDSSNKIISLLEIIIITTINYKQMMLNDVWQYQTEARYHDNFIMFSILD